MPCTTRASRNSHREAPYPRHDANSNKPLHESSNNLRSGSSHEVGFKSPYSPIDSENGEIRLLELLPGKFDDVIQMRLVPHNLSDESLVPYEALSYVWGTPITSSRALLNDVAITSTPNLECALRHLRFTILTRILWIDAISINQGDIQERGHQVQIIRNIYSTASNVNVWLGPVDKTDLYSSFVLETMQLHFSEPHPSIITLFRFMRNAVSLMHEKAGITKNANECVLDVLDVLQNIVSRPWFKRIWVPSPWYRVLTALSG